jgi:DNA-binding protein HU-beta
LDSQEETVNKSELVERLTERLGDKKVATEALDGMIDIIQRSIAKGEKVNITGFGSFEKTARGARTARNPRTGEQVKVKKTAVPKFRAGAQLKAVANGTLKLGREPKHTPLLPSGITTRKALNAVAAATGGNGTAPASARTARPTTAGTRTAKKTATTKAPAKKTTATKAASANGVATGTGTAAKKATTGRSTAKKTSRTAGKKTAPAKAAAATTPTTRATTAAKSTVKKSTVKKSTAKRSAAKKSAKRS